MHNWNVSPAEVFAASPLVPVMVITDLEQAVPMAEALLAGGISVFEITLRTPVALAAIERIARAMPEAMVGAGTVINAAQYDAAVAAGARFVISPGMTPALLAHAARGSAPLIPGVATPSEVMQALEAGYDHLKFFPAEANGGTKALAAIAAPLPQVRFCPTGGIGPKNVADYLALKSVATVGGSWMLPADTVKAGDWGEVTRLSREAVALVSR
ncbi:bifunctional 4-hydroxy-2-oxoglutarate aldolase/2-dehydro-3-deoxy-phosphogluconate aldolase [Aeromonas schubertii]|uniref:2-dehydro-3-deoxy-phosphogluconate aldolase n=1 Tax=Aeromonas schubertii TaxID=652 RepID=A0A0S2SF75_9GAMM|nr:bifunctional 4-hydroxy-2-oxoglutarate aldolase/2-dehydro-3-deoxy-phosphogluconate aldolase [Aeromonas schubertii]ALP40348.1 keto-deoxy-phosphogluconate aldolase [Aeromonas schubertii]MBZ6066552.1 bifunctional 4-hydroxy-2-oxoglutarate aldolase/2-dehydro-3-deoxy-phosphogluconate aldolase [Aeromonas schubertii]QCG49646.1 bifunctional 4-hydroxy-2-oxoglutarate aldolase/2-dehydro-3-deoxy-phosphogluconate aldolase [Aeromonas schubertii]